MATHRIEIPNWHPTKLNDMIGVHRNTKHALRKADDQMIAAYAMRDHVPMAAGKRRVSLEITITPRQRADEDCFWKSTLDALVNCQRLQGDDPARCQVGTCTIVKGDERKTVIILEDAGPAVSPPADEGEPD